MNNTSAVLYGREDLRIEDRPAPTPASGQVLVEVSAVGICGSDVHYYEHGRIGNNSVDTPMVIGHEASGVIVGVGPGVSRERIGERVALEPGVPDGTCDHCRTGRYNLCPAIRFFATPPIDGAICQFVSIDADFAHPIPDTLDLEIAAMAEPVSVAIWAARKAVITPGDRVLVTGAGPIGLFCAQVARAFGATKVAVADVSEFRAGAAYDLGFASSTDIESLGERYTVLLECSGASEALRLGIRALAPAARAVLVGMGADTVSIDMPLVQGRELSIQGLFRYAHTYPLAISILASGAVDASAVITHRFPLKDAVSALTLQRRNPRSLKALVLPQVAS